MGKRERKRKENKGETRFPSKKIDGLVMGLMGNEKRKFFAFENLLLKIFEVQFLAWFASK